jgi:NADPH:quinone reductase-like Zn-dependent oxidoreductase
MSALRLGGDNAAMRGAGIRHLGGQVEELELPDPPDPTGDEVLIEVTAAGIANWDDLVRTGAWDVGAVPPTALGVEAAGIVRAIGPSQGRFAPGDAVLAHSAPFLYQGAWAQRFLAPGRHVAAKPPELDWAVAGALPVPALTAAQVIATVGCGRDDSAFIHGAGGVTGGLLVALAAAAGCRVVATSSPRAAGRVRGYGASAVADYHAADWPSEVLRAAAGRFSVVINAVRGGAARLLPLVADGGRVATITGDPPPGERGIEVVDAYVAPDGRALQAAVADLLGRGLTIPIAGTYTLADAAIALHGAVDGGAQGAAVLEPGR